LLILLRKASSLSAELGDHLFAPPQMPIPETSQPTQSQNPSLARCVAMPARWRKESMGLGRT